MPLLRTEAEKLSQEVLERGIIEEIIDRDDLFALIPFQQIVGKALVYNRENTISEGDFLDPNDTVNEGAATFTEVTTKLRILAGDVDVDKFLATTMGDHNNQTAIQIAQKAKALGRKFRRTLISGNSTTSPKEFDGLSQLVNPALVSDAAAGGANGAAVTLTMLDVLLDQVKNGADALMMRRGTWRAIRALLRAFGGNTAETIMVENFGQPIPAYNGMPVLVNDFMPTYTTGTGTSCDIYAMRLNEVDGVHGIYGGPSAGIQLEDIGTVQNKDANRYRVKWYCGLALKSSQSVAQLKNVTNT